MHPDQIFVNLKYVVLNWMYAHPVATVLLIVSALLMLFGSAQNRAGETYLDEPRARRGRNKALLGVLLGFVTLCYTGLFPYQELIAFWMK